MFTDWLRTCLECLGRTIALYFVLSTTIFGPAFAAPNVILIVADDLGAFDLGETGSRFYETPNLDRLAREGVQFTQAYSACTVCSPTRAALLTGKYPARLKLTDWIPGHDRPTGKLRPPNFSQQLPLAEVTIAEALRPLGYATAHVGKWHLGGVGFGPESQGFDVNLGGDHRGQPPSYFAPYQLPQLPDGPAGEYLTDREGEDAARFVNAHVKQPFLLHVCFYGVHTPLQAKPELVEKYRRKSLTVGGTQTNAIYAAMLESLDSAVGRILKSVEENGLSGNTAVIFTSDNGGLVLGPNPSTSNKPLRDGKGSPYEGGVRVPLFIRWPGLTQPGTRCATPVISMDLPATVLELTGGTNRVPDGLSLAPLLRDPLASLERPMLCWHYPHYHPGGATPYAAIRAGDWKLIQYYEEGRHELYNLRDDPGETTDLIDREPDRAGELAHRLFDWQGGVGAQWPMSNPAWVAPTLTATSNGVVLLHARNAAVHGTTLRYEPMPFKNTLGWWGRVEDWADWKFALERPGTFEVELLQGCGKGSGGSEVRLEVAGQTSTFEVQETGHFQIFVPRRIGRVSLPAGTHVLSVKPQRKPGGAVMDLRQIQLVPVANPVPDLTTPAPLKTWLAARRVVFLGDSITYAGEWVEFVETWLRLQYPTLTTDFLDLGLPSETVSGLSEPGHAGGAFPRPVLSERLGRVLEQTRPDVIVAGYGMNDGMYYPFAEERAQKFQEGLRQLRARAAAVGASVIHVTPPVFDSTPLKGHTLPAGLVEYRSPFDGYDDVLSRYSNWLIEQRVQGWQVVDIHGPMARYLVERRRQEPQFVLAGDGVHANTQGHWLIAREVLRSLGASADLVAADSPAELLRSHPRAAEVLKLVQQRQRLRKDPWLTKVGHLRPGMGAGRPFADAEREGAELLMKIQALADRPFPGRRSLWNGFDRFDFTVDGQPALVVAPKVVAPGRPWLWHGEFFGHKPEPDLALLGRGFHIVYLSVPDQLGSPKAVAHWNAFYSDLTTQYGLSSKPALVGLSRGGLYCYNWAIANPERVSCLYGDAPVCDFRSWPGAFGKGKRSDHDWQLVLERYGFKSDDEAKAYRGNPVDALGPLAAAKVPLLHVYGDADEVVPWEENTGVVAERYRKLGGDITLIAKPGVQHHPHGLEDSTPIVDFIWSHTASPAAQTWLAAQGGGPLDATGRPLLRRLGTVDLDLVETTPVVLNGRLWRFEWVRQGVGQQYWDNQRQTNYFRFRDPATGEVSAPFADGYEFGSAFVQDGTVYVTGTLARQQVKIFASKDLKTWETWTAVPAGRYGIFNTSICRAGEEYVLMFEIDRPVEEAGTAFTARFAKSRDLRAWTLTPPECNYAKDRYTAPHCLRWSEGWFYDFYLEAHNGYELRVVRSTDLVHWLASPLNPVLRAAPEDKLIANGRLTDSQRYRIAHAKNLNNSDLDFCERHGRLVVNYSWGNQQGVEHLAEAVYDGSEAQFLRGWFPSGGTH